MSRLEGERVDVLIPAEAVRDRVAAIGERISRDYAGKPLCLV